MDISIYTSDSDNVDPQDVATRLGLAGYLVLSVDVNDGERYWSYGEPRPLPNIHLGTSLTNAQVLARQAWEALDDEREGDLARLVNDLKAEVDQIHDLVSRW